MPRSTAPVIGILFDDYHPYFKGMHVGIARYARQHTPWQLVVTPFWNPSFDFGSVSRNLRGFIGVARHLRTLEKRFPTAPRVSITYRGDDGLRTVIPNHAQVGRNVAEHLLSRDLRSFGSFMDRNLELRSAPWMHAEFERSVAESGCTVQRFVPSKRTAAHWTLLGEIEDLAKWLLTLSLPVGILATDDNHAWRVIEAASRAGLSVPDDVAVVGVSNDEWFCLFSDPPISSATLNQEGVGYEAARVLDQMLNLGDRQTGITMVPPGEVVVRGSSETFASSDPLVVRALHLIWKEHDNDYKVPTLLRQLHVSRSVLYRSFRMARRSSPAAELRKARLTRAKRLLLNTSSSMTEIAAECGFEHVSQLSREIQRSTGQSPTQFRSHKRDRSPSIE